MADLLEKNGPSTTARKSQCRPPTGALGSNGVARKLAPGRSHQLLELACKVAGACEGGIGLVSAHGDLVEHIPFGISEEAAAEMARSPGFAELIQWVLQQPGPVCLDNLSAPHAELGNAAQGPGRGPFFATPLHCPGRYRGLLYLVRPEGEPVFDSQDVERVEPIRCWMEQGSLYEESHLLSQLRLLKGVAQTAAGNLDLTLILERSLRELDRYLPLHVCAVWLMDDRAPGTLTLATTSSIPKTRAPALGLVEGMQLAVGETPFQDCFQGGQGLYRDLAEEEVPHVPLSERLAGHGVSCFFAAPLRSGDQTVGVLQCVCTRSTGLSGEQIQLLYLVADLLGPAVSNCRLYERLRATYDELRTTQDHLIRVEKMRALGELASGMAHDFNNSLCGVLGFLELTLLDKTLGQSGRNYLESARTCALDAAQTVRRVQDFARWRRHGPVFQPLDINDILRQTVELTRPKWEGPGRLGSTAITVQLQTEATALISGNGSELREVLTNLLFNAVDAMPNGGTLTLRSWSTNKEVFLTIADTGVGMSPAVRQRLFEPFFTTKGEQGNGMGLSVSFGIVQSHGGEITVVSELNQGTTFTIRLPVAPKDSRDAPTQPPAEMANESRPAAEPERKPAGLRILVIDDEESIRSLLQTIFIQLGHRPRLVADAHEGLTAFAEEPFDLVVTDLGLPGMNGDEVARRITVQSPQTPVVLLTGWADQLKPGSCAEGVARILGKPITIERLVETLDALCPRS